MKIEASGIHEFEGYGQDDNGNEVIFSSVDENEDDVPQGKSIVDFIINNAERLRQILEID